MPVNAQKGSQPLRLAAGVEVLGPYQGSGSTETPYLIRCPDGRMVEVSALLHEVAVALDGERELGNLADAVSASTGRRLTAENVEFLVDQKLRPLGLIAGPVGSSPPQAAAPAALALSVRRAVLPGAAVNAITRLLMPLFRPLVVATTLAGLAAVDVWLARKGGIERSLQEVAQRPSLVLLLVVLTLLGAAFHELGHATASRFGGAEPGVIGVGVYLLWPVFYNDLNDSYRLSRGGRLRADLGGVYFNAVFILVTAGWYAISGSEVLLAAVAIQHLAILQQLLPFVRLDGYYVVSDVAGVPDLFGSVRPLLRGLVPGRSRPPTRTNLRRGPRLVVTAWVLVTVPLLVACAVWFVVRMPHLLTLVAETAVADVHALVTAWRLGALQSAGVAALQLVFLALPAVGLSAAALNVLRATWRWVRAHVRPDRPAADGVETSSCLLSTDGLDPADVWLPLDWMTRAERWEDELDPADVWSGFRLAGLPTQAS